MLGHMLRAANTSGIQIVATATSSSSTIVVPSNCAADDVAVLFDRASSTGAIPSAVTPTNWTRINSLSGVLIVRNVVSFKVLTAGNVGSTITGMNGTNRNCKTMIVLRRYGKSTVTTGTVQTDATSATPNTLTVTATTAPYIVFGHFGIAGATAYTVTFSPSESGSIETNSAQAVYWRPFNAGTADVTTSINDAGNDNVEQAFWLKIA